MSKLNTTLIGEKNGKIDARVEQWIVDEKTIDFKSDSIEYYQNLHKKWLYSDDSETKTKVLISIEEKLKELCQ